MSTETPESNLGRRRLLRRAGTVAAGVVGAGAVSAAVAGPAQAAPGDPIVQGNNDAGNGVTEPMVTLDNQEGPALNLAPSGSTNGDDPIGSFRVDGAGNIWTLVTPGLPEMVHTSFTATQLVPIVPQRILNTRTAEGRANVLNPSGLFDASGRLLAGKTINLHVGDYASAAVALHGNVTVTGSVGDGYLTIWPAGNPRPATSVINFPSSAKLTAIANHVVVGIGAIEANDQWDVISIYNSGATAHVVLDVSAWSAIWGYTEILKGLGDDSAARSARSRAAAPAKPQSAIAKRMGGKPDWAK
jgi:hypothetical protein